MSMAFFKKNTFIYWTTLKTEKRLATTKPLIRKTSVWKGKQFFHRVNVQMSLTPLFIFVSFLRTPSPSTLNVLFEWPPIILLNANNLEICPFIKFILEQHHHHLAINCCHCLVNSLVFIIYSKTGVSVFFVFSFLIYLFLLYDDLHEH